MKHKLAGGSGTIDFEDYYTVSVLDQLTEWFQPCPVKLWSTIESQSLLRLNLKWWLMSTPLGSKLPVALSPTMIAWKKLTQNSVTYANIPQIPIPNESLHHLSPDLSLQHWARKGINMKSFPHLQNEFKLPPTDFFSYIRGKHCIEALKLPLYTVYPKAWEYLTTTSPKKKGISILYNTLHQKLHFTKTSPHTHWEKDLGHTYTEHQWQRALQSIYKATKWELTQKLSFRWYLTPSRLASFSSNTSDVIQPKAICFT